MPDGHWQGTGAFAGEEEELGNKVEGPLRGCSAVPLLQLKGSGQGFAQRRLRSREPANVSLGSLDFAIADALARNQGVFGANGVMGHPYPVLQVPRAPLSLEASPQAGYKGPGFSPAASLAFFGAVVPGIPLTNNLPEHRLSAAPIAQTASWADIETHWGLL